MIYKIIIAAMVLASCGTEANDAFSFGFESSHRHQELREKLNRYRTWAKELQHPVHGWIDERNCDGLLYNGLLKFAGLDIDLNAAQDDSGRWHRTPDQGCYSEGRSRSTISRDMIAGWLFGSTRDMRLHLYDYARDRNFKIGDGPIDTVFLTPNFMNTLAITVGKGRVMEEIWVDPRKSHQRHVVALNGIYRNLTSRTGQKEIVELFKTLKHHDPQNMVFFYMLAKHGKAPVTQLIDSVIDSPWFPNDRLPESRDRCAAWVWEKDENRDPCPLQQKVHSGGDFMFMAALILGDFVLE